MMKETDMSKIDRLKLEEERMKLLQKMADKDNRRTNVFDFISCIVKNGLGILVAVGSWGGIYAVSNGGGYRIGLGWLAITLLPFDGDVLLELATRNFVKEFITGGMKKKSGKPPAPRPYDSDAEIGKKEDMPPAEEVDKMNALLDEFFSKRKDKYD
jgi:hypothetical protein